MSLERAVGILITITQPFDCTEVANRIDLGLGAIIVEIFSQQARA